MELIIDNLSKSYGDVRALKSVSLSLNEGVHIFLGPNGSGKSTLFNIISGNLKADCGTIYVKKCNGVRKNAGEMKDSYGSLLGFMPQYSSLQPDFTAMEFLTYMSVLKNLFSDSGKERKHLIYEHSADVLEKVDLSDSAQAKIRTFSGGMRQRLMFAQAILGSPKILILDEPTAGLDPLQRVRINELITELAKKSVVLISTHLLNEIVSLSPNYVILKKGEIAFDTYGTDSKNLNIEKRYLETFSE